MTHIVGLNGFAQSGKDTIGQILVQELGFQRIAFADALRAGVYELDPLVPVYDDFERLSRVVDRHGWDWAKVNLPEVRRLLQVFGTEVGRALFGQNVWVDTAFKQVDAAPSARWVITDVRFKNEAQAIRDRGGIVVKVNRYGVGPVNRHPSDNERIEADYDLDNHGSLAELRESVLDFFVGY